VDGASRPLVSRRRLILAVGILGGLLAVYLSGKAAWRNWCVGKELARIRAAGEPVTADDLSAMYRMPLGTPNATPAWQAAVGLSHQADQFPADLAVLKVSGEVPPPEGIWRHLERAEKFLREQAAAYAQIDAALATPGDCAYLDDFSRGYYTRLDHVQQMRLIERLLVLRAYVATRRGDAAGAAESLVGAWRAAETLRREPFLVTQLVRLVCHQASVEALEHLLSSVAWDDAQLAKIEEQLLTIDYRAGMEVAVLGERVQGIMAFDDPAMAGAGNVPKAVYQLWVRDDRLTHLELMRELLDGVRGEWPVVLERTAKYKAVDRNKTAVRGFWSSASWERPSAIAGPFRGMVERAARETARVRAAVAGVAAARFRLAEGRWPATLEELAPNWIAAVPIDPCTGKPLLFRVEGDGVVLYSVGVDGKDDGGVETPEVKGGVSYRNGTPDVVFRVRDATGSEP